MTSQGYCRFPILRGLRPAAACLLWMAAAGCGPSRPSVPAQGWVSGRDARFEYSAPREDGLRAVMEATPPLMEQIDRHLGAPAESVTGRIVIAPSVLDLEGLAHGAHLRQDTLAAHAGNTIFIQWSDSASSNTLRLAHELVHYRLWESKGESLPLWLDEGLAGWLGWEAAREAGQARGVTLTRVLPTPCAPVYRPEELTSLRSVPEDESRARMFYRQSEALVKALVQRLGVEQVRRMGAELVGGRIGTMEWLRTKSSMTEKDLEEFERIFQGNALGM